MIVRNFNQREVQKGLYQAHGGAEASMLLDSEVLKGILFLAQGILKPGKVIEAHIDPYEEIYYIIQGEATMRVGNEEGVVSAGDAVWVPHGSIHGVKNHGNEDCSALVIAAFPHD